MRVMRPDQVQPLIGDTWAEAKAFWFRALGYKIHADEVRAMHEEECPLIIMSAPARTSKSFAAAHDGFVYGMPTRPLMDSLIWSVGPRYETNKEFDYWFHLLIDRKEELAYQGVPYEVERSVNSPTGGDMEIRIRWDKKFSADGRAKRSIFKGMSATNERSLQGEEVTYAIMSEAAEQDHKIYEKYLSTRAARVLMPTTPKPHADWIRKLKEQVEIPENIIPATPGVRTVVPNIAGHRDPELGVAHFTFPQWANPDYDKSRMERERRKAEIRAKEQFGAQATAEDDPLFAEQFLGQWVYYTGTVLPFNPRRHVIPVDVEQCRRAQVFVSVDYGFRDPAVALFWAVAHTGELVIYREVYERGLTSGKFVDAILQETQHCENLLYVTGDPAAPQVAEIMRENGLSVVNLDTQAQRSREAGSRRLIDWLTEGPHQIEDQPVRPGIYVSQECVHTIHEWKNLRWKEGVSKEFAHTSMAGEDHAFDAARYAIMTRPEFQEPDITAPDWLRHEHEKDSRRTMRRYFPESGGLWL